jgi:hypothetical protein
MTVPEAVLALIKGFPGTQVERTTAAVRAEVERLAAERFGREA